MFRRRRRAPILAEISPPSGQTRLGSLGLAELEACGRLLEGLGASRVVMVTGGTGATAVALGLSTAAVTRGGRAALVETDLAMPVLAAGVGLAGAPGLADYLRHEAEAPQILQPLVLAGPASGGAIEPLVCIVSGNPTSQGPALLASDDFRNAIAKLRSAYDLVVIVGPSGEASQMPVAAQADAILGCCTRSEASGWRSADLTGLVIVG
jgi:MinD-like ATPase involved in chromosome partitioning or flagellar assembly